MDSSGAICLGSWPIEVDVSPGLAMVPGRRLKLCNGVYAVG